MDQDRIVDLVTKAIMDRLAGSGAGAAGAGKAGVEVVAFGNVPEGVLAPGVAPRRGQGPSDVDGAQVIVLTAEAFRAFHGGIPASASAAGSAASACCGGAAAGCCDVDLTAKRLIQEADLKSVAPGSTVRLGQGAILTALARDAAKAGGLTIVKG